MIRSRNVGRYIFLFNNPKTTYNDFLGTGCFQCVRYCGKACLCPKLAARRTRSHFAREKREQID
jgi:hypothetical protein